MAKDFYDVAEKTVTRELKRRVRREKRAACRFMREKSREYRTYTKALAKASFMGDVTDEALKKKAERKRLAVGVLVAFAPVLLLLAALIAFAATGPNGTDREVVERGFMAACVVGPLALLWVAFGADRLIGAMSKKYKTIEEWVLEIRRKGEVPPVEALRRPATERDLCKLDKETARREQDIKKLRKEQQLW